MKAAGLNFYRYLPTTLLEECVGVTYENQRAFFDQLRKQYEAYVDLYRELNGGSTSGIAGFDEFYWNLIYHSKYANPRAMENRR